MHTTKKVLKAALDKIALVTPTRSSNPILTSVRLTSDRQGFDLQTTNLEIDLKIAVSAEIAEGESFDLTVPAHLLRQIVSGLGGELVELQAADGALHVRAGGRAMKLQTGDAQEFPALDFPTGEGITFAAGVLQQAIESVQYAASQEAFQAVFRGVLIEAGHTEATRFVASDGFRLALSDVQVSGKIETSLIVPRRSTTVLARLLDSKSPVEMLPGSGAVVVRGSGVVANVKLLDGNFPDYERVIPRNLVMSVTLPSASLAESIAAISVLSDKDASNRIELSIADGRLTLSSAGDYGEGTDTLEVAQSGSEAALTVALNSKYILNALIRVAGDVKIDFSGATSPLVITGHDGYRAVVVPLRA